MEEFKLEEFLQVHGRKPTIEDLRKLHKEKIIELCTIYKLEMKSSHRKSQLIQLAANHLIQEGSMEAKEADTSISDKQKAAIEMRRMELEIERENKKLEIEAQKQMQREKLQTEMEAQKQMQERKLQAEIEAQIQMQERKLQAEMQIQEKKLQIEKEKLQAEREKAQAEIELQERKIMVEKDIEIERLKASQKKAEKFSESELLKTASLLPKFSEREVEQFFQCFERTAEMFNWPKEKWTLLIQSELTGKAQRIYCSLPDEDAKIYEIVKHNILQAYQLVPEAYRQKFRNWRKGGQQSYLEFAKDKEIHFENWCRAEEVETLDDLAQLILIEEFKNCVNPTLKLYLDEKMPKSITEAAKLSDQFDLTHKTKHGNSNVPKNFVNNSFTSFKPSKPENFKNPKMATTDFKRNIPVCEYCKKKGHLKERCWNLHGKPTSLGNVNRNKEHPIAFVKNKPKFQENDSILLAPEMCEKKETLRREGEQAFCSDGRVATDKNFQESKSIRIWRDTGSFQSLLQDGILPLSDETYVGETVLLYGVGGCITAPLHKIHLDSEMIKGEISVGVVTELPIKGIGLLLGNEIAGSKVGCAPIMIANPEKDSDLQEKDSKTDESTICTVTTRAMSKAKENHETDLPAHETNLDEKFSLDISSLFQEKENDSQSQEFADLSIHETNLKDFQLDRLSLIREQENDPQIREIAESIEIGDSQTENTYFYKENGILLRCWRPPDARKEEEWKTNHQIVLPTVFRNQILSMAHDCPLSGHLGIRKTLYRIDRHFFWPKMQKDVAKYCKTCHLCQIVGKPQHNPQKHPLIPIPAVEEPFSRIICDCVGPLPRSKSGHEYLLTILCASTRFPVAIPLRSINSKNICESLINFFATFGLPKQIQTDQGSNFTSKLFQQISSTLGIEHVLSTAYHPESQGALERFHQTLKVMMRTYSEQHKDWSAGIPLLLFAIRETVQESLGFSPFELVFGHEVRGPLKLIKEKLLNNEEPNQLSTLDYVSKFKERLQEVRKVASENLKNSQERMKKFFDAKTKERTFKPGDKVLVFLPMPNDTLKARYFGPYKILEKFNDVNYLIETPDRRKRNRLCHINMLKEYHDRDNEASPETIPSLCVVSQIEFEVNKDEELITPRLQNSLVLNDLDTHLSHLKDEQRNDVKNLISDSSKLFADSPSVTDWITHDVDVQDSPPIKQRPYRENPEKKEKIKKEIEFMKQNGIIEDSLSNWSSPCVTVPKSDGSMRFCTDFRKVNASTVADCYPLPRIEDCIEKVGQAKIISKIDLLKGYYQIPLTERAKKISAFVTSDGFYQYRVMPFGMKNSAASFQRLTNKIIQDLDGTAVYIDDIIVFSDSWLEHIQRLRNLFKRLEDANLTINLAKSEIAKSSLDYLGFKIGNGELHPLKPKIQVITDFPIPKTRKELRRFLGMIGFYRKFCRNFSDVVSPLTNLTSPKKGFVWTKECQAAFEQAKLMLATEPVLSIPNFQKPFKLMTDASNLGIGSVLFQIDDNGHNRPVAFYSKKFDKHQKNWSAIEKEAFAVIDSLRHFAYYVKSGGPVEVFSDHNPLVFLKKMKNDNQRLLRWSLALQEFPVEIKHVPGKQNLIADCLSRLPDFEND